MNERMQALLPLCLLSIVSIVSFGARSDNENTQPVIVTPSTNWQRDHAMRRHMHAVNEFLSHPRSPTSRPANSRRRFPPPPPLTTTPLALSTISPDLPTPLPFPVYPLNNHPNVTQIFPDYWTSTSQRPQVAVVTINPGVTPTEIKLAPVFGYPPNAAPPSGYSPNVGQPPDIGAPFKVPSGVINNAPDISQPNNIDLRVNSIAHCGLCPASHVSGCCDPPIRTRIERWIMSRDVPDRLKRAVREGFYGQLDPSQIIKVPEFILKRLKPLAVGYITTSQMRALLLKFPDDGVMISNLLKNLRKDYYNVFLTNLKVDIERGAPEVTNISLATHKVISRTATQQWGPYRYWNGPQLTAFSFWIPQLPCFAFYEIQEDLLINTVLPAAVVGQGRLSSCAKHAIFTRMYQTRQLTDMHNWSPDRTITFARLISGSPALLLRTLPQSTMQNLDVLRILTEMDLSRLQVEAILEPLIETTIGPETILAMRGVQHESGRLLNFMPPKLISTGIHPATFSDPHVMQALKAVFCKHAPNRAYKSAYQVFSWYKTHKPLSEWNRLEIGQLGCFAVFMSPLDLAQLNVFEMARDIEGSFSKNFYGGEYTKTQAKILLNFGRRLLHLGSSGWNAERFNAIPPSVVPGIPIHRISEFPWDTAANSQIVHQIRLASETQLGLSNAQIVAFLHKLRSVPRGGLRAVMRTTDLSAGGELMEHIPYTSMKYWDLSDFRATEAPDLSEAQARMWLTKLTKSAPEVTFLQVRSQLYPFMHGMDCEFIQKLRKADIVKILTFLHTERYQLTPGVLRCLKNRLVDLLDSLTDKLYVSTNSVTTFNYWPSLAAAVGSGINQQFNGVEIREMDDDTCRSVVSSATDMTAPRQFQEKMRPRGHRESFIRAALACISRVESNTFRIRLPEAVILKYALSELPGDVYLRVPDEVFFKNIQYFKGGCLGRSQRRGLRRKILSTFGPPDRWTAADVSHIGCLTYQLDILDIAQIPDDSFSYQIQSFGNCWDQKIESNRHFLAQCAQELGYSAIIGLEARIREVNSRLALLARHSVDVSLLPQSIISPLAIHDHPSNQLGPYPALWEQQDATVKDSMTANYGDLKMMREPPLEDYHYHAGINMTCEWFRAAGSHVTSLPASTFTYPGNMSSSAFIRCIPYFGQFNDWDSHTREDLWARVNEEIGFPTPLELETMGSLLLSMSNRQLEVLDFGGGNGLDLLETLGSLELWTDDQLRILTRRFKLTVTPVVENLDAIQLTALGYLLCGLSESEILRLNSSSYLYSSVAIGKMRVCSPWALRALSRVAMRDDTFGAVAGWDASVLGTIGIVVAGLSSAELADLNPESLAGLKCNAVRAMTPGQFQMFKADQMEFFSMDAAMCVEETHVQLLSEAQRYAVWSAGSDAPRFQPRSSAVSFSRFSLLIILIVAITLS